MLGHIEGLALITLTTDFGIRDPYVAEMKGVVLQLNPQATFVDISHHIDPQSVIQGAFVLGSAYHSFPENTIHVGVVDPGVGTSRRAILLVTPEGCFLAPDNGLLTYALRDSPEYREVAQGRRFLEPMDVAIPSDCAAYNLSNRSLWKNPVSDTFHGRDIFAPVAGHLAGGGRLAEVGPSIDPLTLVRLPEPEVRSLDAALVGEVVHVDRFGNLITNLRRQAGERADMLVEAAGRTLQLRRAYVDVPQGELLALVGSSGRVEIACNGASAAKVLGADVGSVVVLRTLGRS